MKAEWCLGIDVLAKDCTVDEGLYTFGPGKVFPGGPSCYVDGKEIPCYCTCTPNASTDDTVLKGIVEQLDKHGLTIRDSVRHPMLIVDGHGSRTGLVFLTYINTKETKWLGMLGATGGTSLWQLHDDQRMNGAFKSKLYKAKASNRLLNKRVNGLAGDIEKSEIVVLLNEVVAETFANKENTKKALAETGWNPMNRNPESARSS
jgi:hypothetical protein